MIGKQEITNIFNALFAFYGAQRWWPTTLPGDVSPSYHGHPLDAIGQFEVAVGAILTQNTNWRNVERAIANLHAAALLGPMELLNADPGLVEAAIRPSGYFRMKTIKLSALAKWWLAEVACHPPPSPERMEEWRKRLLGVKGIGPETADSILLYAFGLPSFVVDAYTRRIMFCRLGVPLTVPYEKLRLMFMESLSSDVGLYKEFHALLVRLGKGCRPRGGDCREKCPLSAFPFHKNSCQCGTLL